MAEDFLKHKLLVFGGLLSAFAYGFLAYRSQYYGDASFTEVMISLMFCAVICMSLWLYYWRQQKPMPISIVILFAVLFRLIAVTGFPLLEDDFYRYLWDGRMTILTGSPYALAPAEFFAVTSLNARFEQVLDLINHPFIATIYGPVCQWVFAGAYLIAPGEIWPLQLFFACTDIVLILLLSKLAKPLYVLLYAWSPLIIKEFAFTAHPDVLGALLLVLSYIAYQRNYFVLLGIGLALAAGVKVFALLLVPFLFGFQIRAWLSFLVTALLLSFPWGIVAAWFPQGLQAMGEDWLFNAPLYFLFDAWFSVLNIKYGLLLLLSSACALYYYYTMRRWKLKVIRADLLFGALFLCIPALNAWYLVWLLPFAVLYPGVWAWAASVSLLLAYASGINLDGPLLSAYEQPMWIVSLEFGAIVLISLLARWLQPSWLKPT